MNPATADSIYVRAPNWVGDFVMATAAFERLRAGFPNARIVVGARPHLLELASGSDWFDDAIPTKKAKGLRGLWDQVKELRREHFDLAVVLPNSPETGLIPFLARIPIRLGYRQGRPLLMNRGLRAPRNRGLFERHGPRRVPEPMPEYYARLLDRLDIPPGREGTVLYVNDAERAAVERWLTERDLGSGRRLLLLTAGAAYGASKLWPPEHFIEFARRVRERHPDVEPVFLAGPAEVEMAESLASAAGCTAATRPVLSLGELKALVERSVGMVTTDTGPRHLSVALGKPTVCMFGSSDPRYTNYSLGRSILIRKDLECSPCQRKVCPLGHNDCMRLITVDEVLEARERMRLPERAWAGGARRSGWQRQK
ncbi:MAG: lipopolysaccharide heptosyltransferase II, partial [Planctomycetes bacterium]|nr:lipopolysaccharide heptosyltransferase II [Planctomycetota bacterium]